MYRGATVHFSVTFRDADGNLTTPDSATVKLKFRLAAGGIGTDSKTLEPDGGNNWKATWDSSVARPGLVSWSLRSLQGSDKIADDGAFTLLANSANTEP